MNNITTTRELYLKASDAFISEVLDEYEPVGYLVDYLDEAFDDIISSLYIYDEDITEALHEGEITFDDITFAAGEYGETDFRTAARIALFLKKRQKFTTDEVIYSIIYVEAKKREQFEGRELHILNIDEIFEALITESVYIEEIDGLFVIASEYDWHDIKNDEQFAGEFEQFFTIEEARELLFNTSTEKIPKFAECWVDAFNIRSAFQSGYVTFEESLTMIRELFEDAFEESVLTEAARRGDL